MFSVGVSANHVHVSNFALNYGKMPSSLANHIRIIKIALYIIRLQIQTRIYHVQIAANIILHSI